MESKISITALFLPCTHRYIHPRLTPLYPYINTTLDAANHLRFFLVVLSNSGCHGGRGQ
jgi:hypothetical protein